MYDIEMENLTVNYDNICALKDVNLKIKDKEFLGIIGPNGGGKSTLLKVLLKLIKPTKGKIKIKNGVKVGYVPQFTTFNRDFPIRVLDVVLMGRLYDRPKIFHKYKKSDIKLAKETMNKLDILKLKDRKISNLSGGQMQKVLIARALMVKPKVLLLDEPTASLDANGKTEIYELLKKLNHEKTIVMVSHDMGVISTYVDSIACLNKTLFYHGDDTKVTGDTLEKVYGCPVELIAHGATPHRVLKHHKEEE
ncbi:metal ABC transporter ATP-binding protein [Dethiothermospora halolimnae]|uniref:metal ABC transporter ATP-binding protein n=1 Tax=Dethiothermospora halolimnae TaxID=3114390 RepID=UPI003CCC3096